MDPLLRHSQHAGWGVLHRTRGGRRRRRGGVLVPGRLRRARGGGRDVQVRGRLGELGIGTNYGIATGTKEILLDEKIGGTTHMAIGASYPETGGKNESAVHWDLVCDLRQGGVIEVDGEELSRDGKFVV
jgi:hypothetical protein